jgi:uncharacterized membrane protein YgcG
VNHRARSRKRTRRKATLRDKLFIALAIVIMTIVIMTIVMGARVAGPWLSIALARSAAFRSVTAYALVAVFIGFFVSLFVFLLNRRKWQPRGGTDAHDGLPPGSGSAGAGAAGFGGSDSHHGGQFGGAGSSGAW